MAAWFIVSLDGSSRPRTRFPSRSNATSWARVSAVKETPEGVIQNVDLLGRRALTFPAVPPDAPAEDAAPLSRPAGPAAAHTTAQPPATAEKPYETHEQIEPIELELPLLPDHDSVITAATEAARLAFSELNTLPGSGGAAESSNRNASVTQKDTFSPSLPAKASPSPTPEMIEAVVSRLLERMQPEIMEVVNREVLRPAIEAMVRRVMEKG